jgi:hypothetical protein
VPLGHKKQLDREGVPLWLEVKKRQEGVVGELFQYQFAAELPGQPVAKGRFARADVAFDGDELVWENWFQGFKVSRLQGFKVTRIGHWGKIARGKDFIF